VPTGRVPPQAWFLVSAVFHYLGPAFAVLLFTRVQPLGVAWLRIVSAAVVFALWRRPWRILPTLSRPLRRSLLLLGLTLAAMNVTFYLAIDRLPLATIGAIEFLGPIVIAVLGLRGRRNLLALTLAVAGVLILVDIRIVDEPLGFVLAFVNCALFAVYVIVGGHIAAEQGTAGIDRLGMSMLIAAVVVAPFGLTDAAVTFGHPRLLAAGFAIGVCSSVIPYVCDQLALARLTRSAFALMLSLLPATATVIGIVVLTQLPQPGEIVGIALIVTGVALHRERADGARRPPGPATSDNLADPPRASPPRTNPP
jgi:inner membrane transporter RhtA